jgi:hypothetical protein
MSIPTEFKGKIYFYWWAENEMMLTTTEKRFNEEYTLLGTSEDIHVKFADPREALVESLRASLARERAESQLRIQGIQGKIQELLAIDHKEDAA